MTSSCVVTTTKSVEKFEENRSIFRVHNKNNRRLQRHQVDGCRIVNGIKCDWLLVDEDTRTEIFIELKGSDVDHAVNQICASASQLSSAPKKKWGYVICTKNPMSSTEVQNLTKQVAKSHGLKLRVKKTVHDEAIESLL